MAKDYSLYPDAVDDDVTDPIRISWDEFSGGYANPSWGFGKFNVLDALDAPAADLPVQVAILLDPAYPNPFNSSTTISYTLPFSSQISVSVFDLSGRRMATVFNGMQQAGVHAVVLTL